MNTRDPFTSTAENGDGHAVERAIFEGEFADDAAESGDGRSAVPESPTRVRWARVVEWWRSSRRVPMALRSRQHARQAAREVFARLLCLPWWYLRAVGRGLVLSVKAWRRWIRVNDYREAAETQEKLADKFTEIRALTLFRWKVTGTALGLSALLVVVFTVIYGSTVVWTLGAVASAALAITGRRKDGQPGRKAVLSGPRSLTWTMDPGILTDAFRDAKLVGKDEFLRVVERASRVGDGWAVTVDLPATRKAADVIKNREALASALAVDEVQLIVERVRSRGGHAGRVAMWVADDDPYASPPRRTPLLRADRWDAWRAVPFGRDARDRKVDLPLVWTSLLIGAIPRQGKTFAARLAASGFVLDPYTRLYVADFKAGKDWDAAARVAHRFLSGDDPEHVLALRDWLEELVSEVQGRYRRMRSLDDDVCPESKVTPEMSRDRSLNMPITVAVVDEVQVPLEDRTPVTVDGKKLPAGEYIGELFTWLAKKAPAAGVVLVLATQRPDSQTIPSSLRAVLGSRFALRVMDWRDSNIILGEQMNTRGYDSSRLLTSHKGVGILRPDGDTDAGAELLAMTVRTYYMPGEDWRAICERGRTLREETGTLTGHAAGDEPDVLGRSDVAGAIGAGTERPTEKQDRVEVPEPLASVLAYLDRHGDGREFVPSAELVEALDMDAKRFGGTMGDLGCSPVRQYVPDGEGEPRRVRGYLAAEITSAAERLASGASTEVDGLS